MGNVGSVQRVVCSSYNQDAGKFLVPPCFKFLFFTQLQRVGINPLSALAFVWYIIFVGM